MSSEVFDESKTMQSTGVPNGTFRDELVSVKSA